MGLSQHGGDYLNNRLRFLKDLIIPEPQDSESGGFKLACSFLVCGDGIGVLPAVQFDDQFRFQRHEIEHEAGEGMLPAEFGAQLTAAQVSPQQALGVGRVIAQVLGDAAFPQPVLVLSVHA